jgi:hypothetical protein
MASFPTSIFSPRVLVDRVGAVYDALKTKVFFAKDHNDPLGEIVAIETALGIALANIIVCAGVAGGQKVIGGSGVTNMLQLQGTSGNGTLTSPAIQALVGNNGATVALSILNNGNFGIGTTSPGVKLDVAGVIRTSSNFQADGASIHAIVLGSNGSALNIVGWNGSSNVSLLYISNGNNSVTAGNIGIGTTSPTARLHLPACVAAANLASLKIDAGVVATTAVSGNIESDGTHIYWTDSGGTRRQLDN